MMEENTQHFWHIMPKDKTTTETHKKICVVCKEDAGTDRTCQKWFTKFCAVDFLLDDAPESG